METVVEIIGVNGDSVVIAGEDTGEEGIWLRTDISGLYDPEIQSVTKPLANRSGTRFLSHRILERTLIFSVDIAHDEGAGNSWRERDSRWRRLWSYNEYTRIRVTTDEGARTLRARLEEIEVDTRFDPHVNKVNSVLMTVKADDPFWYAPEAVYNVTVNGSASIRVPYANPTSNPVFPVWVLEAPGDWTIPDYDTSGPSIDTKAVPLPRLFSHTVVDTDSAARQLADTDNTPVWARMNGVRFRNFLAPWTGEVVFQISLANSSGPKDAQLRLKRPFNRPWGDV